MFAEKQSQHREWTQRANGEVDRLDSPVRRGPNPFWIVKTSFRGGEFAFGRRHLPPDADAVRI
jgi:hypothetical protein